MNRVVGAGGPVAADEDVVGPGAHEVDIVLQHRAVGGVAGVVVGAAVRRRLHRAGSRESRRGGHERPAVAPLGDVVVVVLGLDHQKAVHGGILLERRARGRAAAPASIVVVDRDDGAAGRADAVPGAAGDGQDDGLAPFGRAVVNRGDRNRRGCLSRGDRHGAPRSPVVRPRSRGTGQGEVHDDRGARISAPHDGELAGILSRLGRAGIRGAHADDRRSSPAGSRLDDHPVVVDVSVLPDESGVDPVSVEVQDDRPQIAPGVVHDRMVEAAAAGLARTPRYGVHGPVVGAQRLVVGVAVPAAPAVLGEVAGISGKLAGVSILPVQEDRALIAVAVAAEDHVHPAVLEDGVEPLPHPLQGSLGIRVVRPFAVRRVMPVGHDPVLGRRRQVVPQPVGHRPARGEVGPLRIQADEVDVAVVVGVVGLRPGRQAARFAVPRHRKDLVVRRAVPLVVPARREEERLAENLRVHVEHRVLILGIRPVAVGVVAQHEPHVDVVRAVPVLERVANGPLIGARGSRVADDPDPHRLDGPGRRRRLEGVAGIPAFQRRGRGADRVVVPGIGRQPGHPHLVFRRGAGAVLRLVQAPLAGAVPDPAGGRGTRPPPEGRLRRSALVDVGATGDGLGPGRKAESRRQQGDGKRRQRLAYKVHRNLLYSRFRSRCDSAASARPPASDAESRVSLSPMVIVAVCASPSS